MEISEDRKYIIVCNKHELVPDLFVFWGTLTGDNKERCESGYTNDVDRCERYTLEEIQTSRPSFKVAKKSKTNERFGGGPLYTEQNIIVDRDWFIKNHLKLNVVAK